MKNNKNVGIGTVVKIGSLGGLITVSLLLLLTLVITFLADRGVVTVDHFDGIALSVRLLAFLAGAVVTSSIVKEGKLQATGVAIGVGVLAATALSVFAWDGMNSDTWLAVLECVAAGVVGLFLSIVPRKRKRSARVRYR